MTQSEMINNAQQFKMLELLASAVVLMLHGYDSRIAKQLLKQINDLADDMGIERAW